jgi:hypothetical protein
MGKKSLKEKLKKLSQELEQKTNECDKRGEHGPIIEYPRMGYIALRCGNCHKYLGKRPKYSHRERMEIYERRHIPMTF